MIFMFTLTWMAHKVSIKIKERDFNVSKFVVYFSHEKLYIVLAKNEDKFVSRVFGLHDPGIEFERKEIDSHYVLAHLDDTYCVKERVLKTGEFVAYISPEELFITTLKNEDRFIDRVFGLHGPGIEFERREVDDSYVHTHLRVANNVLIKD